jgi:hypothetical protein
MRNNEKKEDEKNACVFVCCCVEQVDFLLHLISFFESPEKEATQERTQRT